MGEPGLAAGRRWSDGTDQVMAFWQSIAIAVLAGCFGAFLAPLANAFWTLKNWRIKKRFELKYEVFRSASAAVAAWCAGALDVGLQKKQTSMDGLSRQVEMRPEAARSTFSTLGGWLKPASPKRLRRNINLILRIKISIHKIPCTDFEPKRLALITAAAAEFRTPRLTGENPLPGMCSTVGVDAPVSPK